MTFKQFIAPIRKPKTIVVVLGGCSGLSYLLTTVDPSSLRAHLTSGEVNASKEGMVLSQTNSGSASAMHQSALTAEKHGVTTETTSPNGSAYAAKK